MLLKKGAPAAHQVGPDDDERQGQQKVGNVHHVHGSDHSRQYAQANAAPQRGAAQGADEQQRVPRAQVDGHLGQPARQRVAQAVGSKGKDRPTHYRCPVIVRQFPAQVVGCQAAQHEGGQHHQIERRCR